MEILKKIYYITIFFLFLGACSSFPSKKSEVKMEIVDKEVRHGMPITVLLKNYTKDKIYLPLDYTEFAQKAEALISRNERVFFLAMKNIERRSDHKWIPIVVYDCNETTFVPVVNEWNRKIKNKSINNLILLEPREQKTIKLPFHLYQEMAQNCNYQFSDYKTFKNNEYLFYLTYDLREDHSKDFLSKAVRDSLKEQNYKIYTGLLKSNKIPLIID